MQIKSSNKRKLQLKKKTVKSLTDSAINYANGGFGPSYGCPEKTTPEASCKTCASNIDCKSFWIC
jgi:hypothetical protein